MDNDLKSLEYAWPIQQKTIRADIISNKKTFRMLVKYVLLFFIICYGSRLLPDAEIVIEYTPEIWNRTDILDLHQISPLNRKIKVYVAPANDSEEIDPVYSAEVYTLSDNQEKEKRLEIKVLDLDQYTDITEGSLKFNLGDFHVLDEVAYRIKINKPMKVWRILEGQSIQQGKPINSLTNQSKTVVSQQKQFINKTLQATNSSSDKMISEEQSNMTSINQTEHNLTAEELKKLEELRQIQEEKRKKEGEERIKKEQEEAKKRQEQEKKRKQQEEKKKLEEQAKKIQQERKKQIYEHTNIRLQAHMFSSFATILQLIVRYISMLVIIYMVADNPDAPRAIALICTLYSNPFLFLQISFPNKVSNIIDMLCQSGPYLYLCLWLYYIHTKVKYSKDAHKISLGIKIALGIALYFFNVLRLLHFNVLGWQTLTAIIVSFLVSLHLWQGFLNLQYQHHRDKILTAVTITFLGCLFTFKTLAGPWQDLIIYIIIQLYGFTLIYLTGCKKKKKKSVKNLKNDTDHSPHIESQKLKQKV